MSRIFDPENKFWNAIGKVADVTCMSLLWSLTSLPLVTIGAATTAFYAYTMRQVRDTEGSILSGFFGAFKQHFKKATLLWLLEAAGIAFFAADLVGVWNLYLFVGGLPAILVGALVLCLTILFLGCTFYIWPLLAVFDFPLKKLLGNSFIMAVGNLPVTLTLALLWALAGVGCFYMSGVFFVWVGLAIFVSSYFINTVFKKYTGELAEEQAAWEQADRERKQRKKMQKAGGRKDELAGTLYTLESGGRGKAAPHEPPAARGLHFALLPVLDHGAGAAAGGGLLHRGRSGTKPERDPVTGLFYQR